MSFFKSLFGKKEVERVEPEVEAPVEVQPVSEEETGELTIKAISYNEETGQIKIDVDWDDNFVAYLKRHGFTGASEETIVQKYIATMYQNVTAQMSAEGKDYE